MLATASAAAAQTSLPDPGDYERNFTRNTHYLTHLQGHRSRRDTYLASPEWKSSYLQLGSWLESFVGNYARALADDDALASPPTKRPELVKTFSAYRPVDARDYLFELAESHPVIMVNEAHHMPEHRAFTLTLLKGLYDRGFRYFAAEALDERDTNLTSRGYPTFATGYYCRDPVFADMVRTAIKIGFRIVPYEATAPVIPFGNADPLRAINAREQEQAEHLRDRIFKQDPKAKVLVHVGYGHHSEKTTDLEFEGKKGQIKPMGVWFKELTGIDPVTVDSNVMRPRSDISIENEFYQWAVKTHPRRIPVVFRDATGRTFSASTMRGINDLMVLHPRTTFEHGRPRWLGMRGIRSPFAIPANLRPLLKPGRLLQAFAAGEDLSVAVPLDQIEITAGPLPRLMLPKRVPIKYRVLDAEGAQFAEESPSLR